MTESPKPPSYRKIADALRSSIGAGRPPPGEELATAAVLAKEWKVGTTTVHRAFAALEAEGLVDIRPGVPVRVRKWPPIMRDANKRLSAKQWGQGHSIWTADVGERPMTVDVATSLVEEVPDEVRAELDAALYLMRDRVFRVDKQRVQLATSYLDAALASGTAIEAESTGEGGTFARLRELGVEPSRFREDLRVRYPTPDEAKRLQVGSQRPVVEILRSSATEELYVVEVTHMVLVADAYVLRYHLHS